MTSELSVERQFRFHCPCGATLVTGERTATCTSCGITLGVRRVRRHRQHRRDSVAYYGSASTHTLPRVVPAPIPSTPSSPSWTLPVRRVEKRRQDPNTETAIPSSRSASRLSAWMKSALASCGQILKVSRVEKNEEPTTVVPNVEAQSALRNIPDIPRELPAINESPRRPLLEGVHVKVGPTRPDGRPHPHVGETGRITRFINSYTDPYWLGLPTAMIKLDSGIKPQGFIWVSLASLEELPEIHRDSCGVTVAFHVVNDLLGW